MSDYLSRLIERSLGTAQEIEPLIAPLHAPSDQLREKGTDPSAGLSPRATQTTRSVFEATTPDELRNAAAATETEDGVASPEFGRMEEERSRHSAESKSPRESAPVMRKEVAGPRKQAAIPKPLQSPRAPSPVVAESIELPNQKPRVVAQPATTARSESIATRDPVQSKSTSAPASPGPGRIVVQPHISRPSAPAASTGFRRQSASTEPPAIHVTIGRVEVRAILSQPEPPRRSAPPPATPKISLEEYLKQRNGGTR
jgi:hypothetical protein